MDELTLALQDAVTATAEWIQKTIKDSIQRYVYAFYAPEKYGRTFEFLDSFDIDIEKLADVVIGKVFYNPDLLLTHNPSEFQHGSHYSRKGDDIRPALAEIIDQNLSGPLFGDGPWWQRQSFFDAAMAEIDAGVFKKFEEEMTKRGIPWNREGVTIAYG